MKRILLVLVLFAWTICTAIAQLVYSFDASSMTLTITGEGPLIESRKVNTALGRSSSEEWDFRLQRLNIITSGPVTIEPHAFANCITLNTVSLPEGLIAIGGYAFSGTNLSSITFPSTLVDIGEYLFDRSPVRLVVCLSPTEPIIKVGLGVNMVYAPHASGGFTSSNWGFSADVWYGEYPPEFTYDFNTVEGLLTIGGRGGVVSASDITGIEPIQYLPRDLKHVNIIADGFHTVGKRAFFGCSSLKTITLPQGIKTLQKEAFSQCLQLHSITCLSSVEPSIEGKKGADFAFQNAAVVCTVYVPNASSGFSVGNWQYNNVITIQYGSYPTGIIADVRPENMLETYLADNLLHIVGLEAGAVYSVIQANGSVVSAGIATDNHTTVALSQQGLYLIQSGGRVAKVVY